jgi:Transposase zinc-ribbon domain
LRKRALVALVAEESIGRSRCGREHWSLSLRKRAKAMADLIKLTNLLDEAKCYEVIRQLRWPDGVVCLHCSGRGVVRNQGCSVLPPSTHGIA